MAALVKTNGLFGRLYMAAIKPFRYLIVYPALTRQSKCAWRDRNDLIGLVVARQQGKMPVVRPSAVV